MTQLSGSWKRAVILAAALTAMLVLGYLIGSGAGAPAAVPAPTEAPAPTATAGSSAAALVGTRWLLTAWSISSVDLQGLTIDLEFLDGRLSGRSAVNVYNADYTAADAATLRVGAVAATKMAGPEPAMQAETLYLTLLQAVAGWRLEGTTLTLLDADGQPSLVFTQQ
jgi:heat shock protein HslJ